jgi:hypothetical protein
LEVDFFCFLFFKRFIQLKYLDVTKTSCGGSPPKKVCSRSSPFTHWLAQEVVAFLGKVFGALRFLQWRVSFRGQQLLVRSLPYTISRSSMLS